MSKGYKKNYSNEERDQFKNDIENKLIEGVKNVLSSENWREYLKLQSKFHRYSFANTMLIQFQRPGATKVAGYKKWIELGRQVNKGEQGIKIFGFATYQYFIDNDKVVYLNQATPDQLRRIEKKELQVLTGKYFPIVTVFDVAQTSGEELPSICKEIKGDSEEAEGIISAITDICDIPIIEEKMTTLGYFKPSMTKPYISLKEGTGSMVKASTLIHEYSHYYVFKKKKEGLDLNVYLHDKDKYKGLYAVEEIIVESVAYIIGQFYGLDSSEYSFEYISSWSRGNVEKVKEVGKLIQEISQDIIDKMEKVRESYNNESEETNEVSSKVS